MSDLGEDLTENEIDLMMKEADKDSDGKIDYEEFRIIMNTQKEKNHSINKQFKKFRLAVSLIY